MSRELTELRFVGEDVGYGSFARMDIEEGTLIQDCADVERYYFSEDDLEKLRAEGSDGLTRLKTYAVYEGDSEVYCEAALAPWVLGKVKDVPFADTASNENFINHCCDPNLVWTRDDKLVARRKILAGEELSYDYATEDVDVSGFKCCCKSPLCRGTIEGEQWRDVAHVYGEYFRPNVFERVQEMRANSEE